MSLNEVSSLAGADQSSPELFSSMQSSGVLNVSDFSLKPRVESNFTAFSSSLPLTPTSMSRSPLETALGIEEV